MPYNRSFGSLDARITASRRQRAGRQHGELTTDKPAFWQPVQHELVVITVIITEPEDLSSLQCHEG